MNSIEEAAKAYLESVGYDYRFADEQILQECTDAFKAGTQFTANQSEQSKATIDELVKALESLPEKLYKNSWHDSGSDLVTIVTVENLIAETLKALQKVKP